jgi:hypothetical protein
MLSNSKIGESCNIGQNVVIGPDVDIGKGCKIQNNVSVFKGITLEESVSVARQWYSQISIVLHINNFIASKALYYAISALFLSFFITQITLVASFRYFSNAFTTEVLKSSNVGKNLQ